MAMNSGFDREVRFEIVEHIGILSTYSTGWNKELNLVSWNGGQPKYDIRDWDLDHEHMSRGVTLHEKEMRQVFDLMKRRRMENRFRRDGFGGGDSSPRADGFERSIALDKDEEPFDAPVAPQPLAEPEDGAELGEDKSAPLQEDIREGEEPFEK